MRVQTLLELDGTVLTESQLSRMAERYPRCEGTEHWDVREYARHGRLGGREYRVVRGAGIQDVYASEERASAAAVRMALNELEAQEPAA
jgi:hypothetical protein